MSISINKKSTFNKTLSFTFGAVLILALTLSSVANYSGLVVTAAANSGELIIGKTDAGSAIDISVCVRATDVPIHLTNVSTWLQFDNSVLRPNASILEKGVYGNGNNGYANMKWEQVQPAPVAPSTLDQYTLRLDFIGDAKIAGSNGIAMQTSKELFGTVKFDKIAGATGSQDINLTRKRYMSIQSPLVPITQNVIFVEGDCRTSDKVMVQPLSNAKSTNNPIAKFLETVTQAVMPTNTPATTQESKEQNSTDYSYTDVAPQSDVAESYDSIRSGGFSPVALFALITIVASAIVFYKKTLTKKLLEYSFDRNTKE
jgi:hypothetical protein